MCPAIDHLSNVQPLSPLTPLPPPPRHLTNPTVALSPGTSAAPHPAAQLLLPPGPTTPQPSLKGIIYSEDMHVDVHIKTQYYDTVEVHTCTCIRVLTHACTRIRFLLFL